MNGADRRRACVSRADSSTRPTIRWTYAKGCVEHGENGLLHVKIRLNFLRSVAKVRAVANAQRSAQEMTKKHHKNALFGGVAVTGMGGRLPWNGAAQAIGIAPFKSTRRRFNAKLIDKFAHRHDKAQQNTSTRL
jgi:hypothetical protein